MTTLSVAISEYVRDSCEGKSNDTPVAYRRKLERFMRDIGSDPELAAITPADIERCRTAMLSQLTKRRGGETVNEHLSVWYVRGVLRTVKQMFRWFHEHGAIPTNPAAGVKLPKEPPNTPKSIDPNVFDRLLITAAKMGEPWERARNVAFLCLLRDSGGRLGALLAAKADDVVIGRGFLSTVGKGGQEGVLFFNPPTAHALQNWFVYRDQIFPRASNVFICGPGKSNGKVITPRGVYSMFARLAEAAGLPEGTRINPHSFRHAFARDSIMLGGADISEVSQMMWHKSIRVTNDFYARFLPRELKDRHMITSPGARIELPDMA